MVSVRKVLAPLALAFGMAGTAAFVMADGQPPFGKGGDGQPPFGKGGFQPPFGKGGQPGKGDKKDEKKDDKKGEKKGEEKKGQPTPTKGAPRPDATVDAWVKVLIEKITDPHDTVRDSARGALVGVGPAALPALQKLADGDDTAKAVAARKLINAIQGQGRGPGQPGGPGRGPGGPGMGGPGGPGMGGPGGPGMGGPGGPGMGGPGGPGMGGPGGPGGMNPMGPGPKGERGGFGPGGFGRGGFGGFGGERGRGPGRGGRDESDVEVAPMPRATR